MSGCKPRCDWHYKTTAGLTMGCVMRIDHKGPHLDSAGRWWTTVGEGEKAVLLSGEEQRLAQGSAT